MAARGATCASSAIGPLVHAAGADGRRADLAGWLQGIAVGGRRAAERRRPGGTPLKQLGDELLERGLAQENLGDIDVQSIAGAISTGTHGTGVASARIATQVAGLTLVTAAGEVIECSERERARHLQGGAGLAGRARRHRRGDAARRPGQAAALRRRRERVRELLANLEELQAREQPLRVLLVALHQVGAGQVPQRDRRAAIGG